jgi:uridine monophosphate synthetase
LANRGEVSFLEKLRGASEGNDSLLCVGLDPHHFPAGAETEALVRWGRGIIEQTADLVCCYKPNFAFYEQYGPAGLEALRQTIAAVPAEIPVLLDVKRGDIGSTATAYARAAFEVWGADAATVNPYLGRDGVAPFLAYAGKMAFVLCHTSNPSAETIQGFRGEAGPLFAHIVRQAQSWGETAQIGFVVGATQPQALARVRALTQSHWLLAPGVGAQGGDLAATLAAGLNAEGSGLIVSVSRGILYADDPRAAAQALWERINRARRGNESANQRNSEPAKLGSEIGTKQGWPARGGASSHTELINELHEVGCIQFGQFTLASGRQSPIYIDLRRMTAAPGLLRRAAEAYAELLRPLSFDHLAGVPYAALTIGTAVALAMNRPLIYPRKEAKAYGLGKNVEGVFTPGDKAVVIEDLVTSGGSVLSAIETLEGAGLVVSDVAVLIDREQGGLENLAEKGYRLHATLRISEILKTLQAAGRVSTAEVAAVKAYLGS